MFLYIDFDQGMLLYSSALLVFFGLGQDKKPEVRTVQQFVCLSVMSVMSVCFIFSLFKVFGSDVLCLLLFY